MNKEKQFLAMFGRMARELRQEKPQTGAQIEEARKIPDNYTYAYEDQKMTIYHFRNAKQQYFCMVFIENELKPRFYGQFQNLQTAIERGKNGQERIEQIQHECNHPKSELIRLWSKIQELSPAKADKLDKIIGELEAWQHL